MKQTIKDLNERLSNLDCEFRIFKFRTKLMITVLGICLIIFAIFWSISNSEITSINQEISTMPHKVCHRENCYNTTSHSVEAGCMLIINTSSNRALNFDTDIVESYKEVCEWQ